MSATNYRGQLDAGPIVDLASLQHDLRASRAIQQVPSSGIRTVVVRGLADLEAALATTPLRDWHRLAADAPHASLFQSPGWCLPWCRIYHDDYTPFVVVTSVGATLVGVVPMAIEHATGRLVFASDALADYRDIVAKPEHRADVLRGLLREFRRGRFPDPLQVGWLDPASDTATLLADICARERIPVRLRHQPCYRWFPPPPTKPSAQKFLNWYKRQGAVTFDVVASEEAWHAFRDEYYRQHSLRQIQSGRPRAFDDPRRTRFYDELFRSSEVQPHVTAFRLDGRLLAGHFGYVWRGVLSLGPPALRLEEEQRSPAVILFAWIIQNAERLGLRGFDLTIGDSDFKRRLGNQCVELTAVEVYANPHTYRRQRLRSAAVDAAKAIVARLAGATAWDDRVKPAIERLAYKRARFAEEGLRRSLVAGLKALAGVFVERRRGHVYAARPADLRVAAPVLDPGDRLEFHENQVEDLLRWDGSSLTTASAIQMCARGFSRCRASGRTLHTIVLNDRLAGWGYSYYPDGPAQLTETPGVTLTFPDGAAALYDFHVLTEFRGRKLYQALLTHILQQRFAEGAPAAYITVLASNAPSRRAIERVGFQLVAANDYARVLRRERVRPVSVDMSAVPTDDYESYLEGEWQLFAGDPGRQQDAVRALRGITVRDVLDVGCGGGQDMIPFAASGAACVGIDITHESGRFARRLFASRFEGAAVRFVTARAEQLPFAGASFDVVLCRVALPYTENRRALLEMARVLRPGGILLLKTHQFAYYVRKALDGIRQRSPLFSIHALRVMVSGALYHVTARQPGGGTLLRETFQSRWLLARELKRGGLTITRELPDSNALTRSYRIEKRAS